MQRARVPAELAKRPFTLHKALAAGITPDHLRGPSWIRIAPQIWAARGAAVDTLDLLAACQQRLPRDAVFSGPTAAWLHGLELPPTSPIDVTLPPTSPVSQRVGLKVHRARLAPGELAVGHSFPATSIARTLFDLARLTPFVEAVIAADMALHADLIGPAELDSYARRKFGPGSAKLRRVVEHAEPKTESPMETRLRMLLVRAGLPRPEAQVELRDVQGQFLARADLYYSVARLAIEFDGSVHRDQLTEDSRRQNQLLSAGYRLLRFTTADVRGRPEEVVALVRTALASRRSSTA